MTISPGGFDLDHIEIIGKLRIFPTSSMRNNNKDWVVWPLYIVCRYGRWLFDGHLPAKTESWVMVEAMLSPTTQPPSNLRSLRWLAAQESRLSASFS